MNGILIIDKPKDFTSFDVIAVVRGCLHERRAGHTGTLDPMATGVLPVLLGNATKAQSLLTDTDKEYEADFMFGVTTDTLDITGKVLSRSECDIDASQTEAALVQFRGDIMQLPPMYSAVMKNGVRLYELARKGIEAEREPRPVHISLLELVSFDRAAQSGRLRISCSKGTYIRSLCDDLGRLLGCGCVMTALRRTRACGYDLSQAVTLDRIRSLADEGFDFQSMLLPTDTVFFNYSAVYISEKQAFRFNNGGELDFSRIKGFEPKEDRALFRVYSQSKTFLGLGEADSENSILRVKKLFPEK